MIKKKYRIREYIEKNEVDGFPQRVWILEYGYQGVTSGWHLLHKFYTPNEAEECLAAWEKVENE
jgi:hypothetical protein